MTGHAARLLKATGALVALLAVVVGVPVLMAVALVRPDTVTGDGLAVVELLPS